MLQEFQKMRLHGLSYRSVVKEKLSGTIGSAKKPLSLVSFTFLLYPSKVWSNRKKIWHFAQKWLIPTAGRMTLWMRNKGWERVTKGRHGETEGGQHMLTVTFAYNKRFFQHLTYTT